MLWTFHAKIDDDGSVHLLESVILSGPRRALVTLLDDSVDESSNEDVLADENALSDWSDEAEDAAWAPFQEGWKPPAPPR